MKLLFVVNPISGGVDKAPFLEKAEMLCRKYGIDYKIFKTTGENDQKNLKELLDEYNPDRIASVGGDGTTLFTSLVLLNKDYPMGIIPLGSANGMAKELSVHTDPIEALKDIILSHVIVGLDIVVVNDEYYSIHIGDVGVNANIVEAYSKDDNRGMTTYAKYFIAELRRMTPFNMTIKTDDKTDTYSGVMMAICNSRKYGTGVPLNITSNPIDGNFEIVVVKNINLNSIIKAGLSTFDERFYDNYDRTIISAKKAQILFEEPKLLQLDGEVVGEFKELNIRILEGAVKIITHHDNEYIKNFRELS